MYIEKDRVLMGGWPAVIDGGDEGRGQRRWLDEVLAEGIGSPRSSRGLCIAAMRGGALGNMCSARVVA